MPSAMRSSRFSAISSATLRLNQPLALSAPMLEGRSTGGLWAALWVLMGLSLDIQVAI